MTPHVQHKVTLMHMKLLSVYKHKYGVWSEHNDHFSHSRFILSSVHIFISNFDKTDYIFFKAEQWKEILPALLRIENRFYMQCTLYLSLICLVSLLHLLLRSIMSNLSQVIQRFYISSENDVTTSLAPLWFNWVRLDSYGTFKSQTIIFSKLGPFSCSVELQHILIASLGLKQTPFSHKFTSLTSVQFIFIKLSQRWTRRRDCARWLNSPWGTCVSAIFLLQFLSVPALEKKQYPALFSFPVFCHPLPWCCCSGCL